MKCSCTKHQRQLIIYTQENELPPPLREVIQQCPSCRHFFEEQLRVASLVHLKNYETPDPAWEERSVMNIQRAIRLGEDVPKTASWLFPSLLWMRAGFAVVAVSALAILFWQSPGDQGAALITGAPVEPVTPDERIEIVDAEPAVEGVSRPNPEMTAEVWSNLHPRIRSRGAIQLIHFEP